MSYTRAQTSCLALFIAVALPLGLAPGAAGATQSKPRHLKAVLALSARATTVGQRIVATVARSTTPKGDSLRAITVRWGDRTKSVSLRSLSKSAAHRYVRPGRYTVSLVITDKSGKTARATKAEVVTAPAGSYSGLSPSNRRFTFYVSADGRHVQDVYIDYVQLQCAPGGAFTHGQLHISSAAISANGAFSATVKESDVFVGQPAKFTYVFAGRFHGLTSAGVPEATGTLRETITYSDSAARTCTSDTHAWTVTKDAQPTQRQSPPPAGSYTGLSPSNRSFTFYVSANHHQIQDVYIDYVALQCVPGGANVHDVFAVAAIPIRADGSFASTTTQTGVFAGQPAKFTYSFRGNFHSVNPAGAARAAGTFRQMISYTDSAARTCSSDTQSWTVGRTAQQKQTSSAPPAGTYSGLTPYNRNFTFDVASSRTTIHDVAVDYVSLQCTPGGASVHDQITIGTIPIKSDRSFAVTTSHTGVFAGHAAMFAYSFRGHFHSVNNDGVERAAGTFRETITYTDSAARTCTSNDQSWTVARTG